MFVVNKDELVFDPQHTGFRGILSVLLNGTGFSSDGLSVRPAAAEHEHLLSAGSAAILQPPAATDRRPQPTAVHAAPPTAAAGRPPTADPRVTCGI